MFGGTFFRVVKNLQLFIITSHLWFLIVLAGITIGCLPFHIIARTIIMDDNIVFNQQQQQNGKMVVVR